MDGKGLRTKPPDHNGGATRPVGHGKPRDPKLRSEFCTPALLAQSKVRAVFVMVGNVFRQQPFQVPLVESNYMVEQLAAAASHPTLGDAILPGTCERSAQGIDVQESNGCPDLCPVFCI